MPRRLPGPGSDEEGAAGVGRDGDELAESELGMQLETENEAWLREQWQEALRGLSLEDAGFSAAVGAGDEGGGGEGKEYGLARGLWDEADAGGSGPGNHTAGWLTLDGPGAGLDLGALLNDIDDDPLALLEAAIEQDRPRCAPGREEGGRGKGREPLAQLEPAWEGFFQRVGASCCCRSTGPPRAPVPVPQSGVFGCRPGNRANASTLHQSGTPPYFPFRPRVCTRQCGGVGRVAGGAGSTGRRRLRRACGGQRPGARAAAARRRARGARPHSGAASPGAGQPDGGCGRGPGRRVRGHG